MKKLNIKRKMLEYCKLQGVNFPTIAKKLSVSRSSFAGQNLECGLNSDVVVTFLDLFDDLSAEWLMRGEGSMLKSERQNGSTLTQTIQGDGNNASISTVNASPNASQPPSAGCNPDICSLMKAKDAMIQAKNDLISAKDDMIRTKDEVIAAQNTTIATLQKALDSLR